MTEDNTIDDATVVPTKMLLPSIIRTVMPIILCSSVVTTLFPNADSAQLEAFITALITVVYYITVRCLEHYVSGSFSWLLGSPLTPSYFDVSDVDIEETSSKSRSSARHL
jgi:uncharacterized MnhB-related membrane protein